jgi:zinc transport system substrate-binding protein
MKKITSIALLLLLMIMLGGCGSKDAKENAAPGIKVLTTVYPVYEIARQVGGDKVSVEMLLPPGAEPHDWEPTAKDLAKLKSAKIFLYHGAGLEPTDKLLTKDVLGETKAVEVSSGLNRLTKEHADENEAGHNHSSDAAEDPHLWLDPANAKLEVKTIAAALAAVDPANATYYQQRAEQYNAELTKLDEEYRNTLAKTARKELVTTHSAFAYLAKEYGLTQVGIMGLSPEAEPTMEKLREVAAFCREHQVKVIFFESQANPKVAATIAKETGAQAVQLNPLESLTESEMKEGKNYLSVMRDNLSKLHNALQ